MFRASPEGFRGPPGGASSPGGLHGPRLERDQPQSGLVCFPPLPKAQLGGERGNPRRRWAYRPTLGRAPSLPLLAAPSKSHLGLAATPRGGNLGGGAAPSHPIYSGGIGAAHHMSFFSCWRSPTSLSPHISRCLAKPCWTTTLLHHHHAIVLLLDGVFLNLSLSPCWIKAWETSPGCTCVERGGTVLSVLRSESTAI